MSHSTGICVPFWLQLGSADKFPLSIFTHLYPVRVSVIHVKRRTDRKTERRVYWQTCRSQYSLFAVCVSTHLKKLRNFCVRYNMVTNYRTLGTAFLWVITQRVVVISYRRFGTTCRSHLQGHIFGFLTLEYGPGRLSRNVGKELPLLAA